MSTIWTPGGERYVPPKGSEEPPRRAEPPRGDRGEPSQEELEALRDQLARTPAAVVVANHCMGLFELAALHLSLSPPQLDQAQLAIDAMAALVEGLAGRLGDAERQMKDALAQLRLAFVQLRAAAASPAATSSATSSAAPGPTGPADPTGEAASP